MIRLNELPDVPLTNTVLDISGDDPRPTAALSSLLLIGPDQGDPGCIENDAVRTTFTPQGSVPGGSDDVMRTQNTTITNCL